MAAQTQPAAKKLKIHVVESISLTLEQKKKLDSLGEVKYFEGMPDADELVRRMEGADVVCLDWAPIDAALPKAKQGTKLVSLPFTGVGFIPLHEATARGIKISNSPGFSTESVAEFGIGLMIGCLRKIYQYYKFQTKPEVEPCLYGKMLTILGAGRIGTRVGKIAEALGMRVTYWRRGNDLHSALKQADVVYCALPLSDETRNLLGEKQFTSMNKGAYFVTTSHNKIYDHDALLHAIDSGHLAGAAMDSEGTNIGDYNSELYQKFGKHPKVLLTPHVGSKADYAIKRGYDMMIDNVESFVKGKPINIVN